MGCGISTDIIYEPTVVVDVKLIYHIQNEPLPSTMFDLTEGDTLLLQPIFYDSLGHANDLVFIQRQVVDSNVLKPLDSFNLFANHVGQSPIYFKVFQSSEQKNLLLIDTLYAYVMTSPDKPFVTITTTAPSTIHVGDQFRFVALVQNQVGETLSSSVRWTSSDSGVVVVDENGLAQVFSAGSAVISAHLTGADISSHIVVALDSGKQVAYIQTNFSQITISQGDSLNLIATAFSAQGDTNTNQKLVYEVESKSLASVSADGQVIALAIGQSQLIIRGPEGAIKSIPITVTLNSKVVFQVIPHPLDTTIYIGETFTYTANLYNQIGAELVDRPINYSLKGESVTLSEQGKVTAVAVGVSQITATAGGASFTTSIKVNPLSLQGTFESSPGSGYNVTGKVTLQVAANGKLEVVLGSDFEASNGPGLVVYLSKTEKVMTSSLELGALQANKGLQTYTLSSNVSLTDFKWVIIHCKPFNVTFGYAQIN